MAIVAMVGNGERRIEALPGEPADVEHIEAHEVRGSEDRGNCVLLRECLQMIDTSAAMRMPVETLQEMFMLLSPIEFNDARHTCRLWYFASLHYGLLMLMLKRGGWWSSMMRLLSSASSLEYPSITQEMLMSKWISRECNLSNTAKSAFVEVGNTDFRPLGHYQNGTTGFAKGNMDFTVSQCGKFVLVAFDSTLYVYELNHSRRQNTSLVQNLPQDVGAHCIPLGVLRPVTKISCPATIIACSMDTTTGRCAVAVLMISRLGMVYEIMPERLTLPKQTSPFTSGSSSGSSSPPDGEKLHRPCICMETPLVQDIPQEDNRRSVYRNICHSRDLPLSVALSARRDCVVFGCSTGIELH